MDITTDYTKQLNVAGDVAFFNSPGLSAKVNKLSQTTVSRSKANFSHVALYDGQGGFFHADLGDGVCKIYFDEIIQPDFSGYKAFRHKVLCQRIMEDHKGFYASTVYFLGQNYIKEIENGKFLRGAKKFLGAELEVGETFCSKLVNDCFRKFAPECAFPDEKPLPVDLQKMVNSDDWIDVTDLHKTWFQHLLSDASLKQSWIATYESMLAVREGIKRQDETTDLLHALQGLAKTMETLHGARHPILDADFSVPEGPVSVWDQKHGAKNEA